MRFTQARDVLKRARDFHAAVAAVYQRLGAQSDRQRVRMLLHYLEERETQLGNSLDEFLNDASRDVLDSWFQFSRDDASLPSCPDMSVNPDMSADEVIQLGARFHACLTELYGEVARAAESPQVRSVFENLRTRADNEWRACCRNARMMDDM